MRHRRLHSYARGWRLLCAPLPYSVGWEVGQPGQPRPGVFQTWGSSTSIHVTRLACLALPLNAPATELPVLPLSVSALLTTAAFTPPLT